MKRIQQIWSQFGTPQKIAYSVGYGVMLTGLVHLVWYLVSPGAILEGPVGFRKPMVFGLSAGFTLVTMGWLLNFYKSRPRLHTVMMSMMSAALVIEIIIIDMQRIRGLPSHFNMGTPLDAALWSTMGITILVFATVATTQAILSFGKLTGTPSMNLAIRISMLLFFFSQLSGQFVVTHGMSQVLVDGTFILENVETSTTVGEAGNLKLPHAISLHSIQALPLLGLLLLGIPFSKNLQLALVVAAGLGFSAITAFAQTQAFAGKAMTDLTAPQTILMGACVLVFLAPYAFTLITRAAGILSPVRAA